MSDFCEKSDISPELPSFAAKCNRIMTESSKQTSEWDTYVFNVRRRTGMYFAGWLKGSLLSPLSCYGNFLYGALDTFAPSKIILTSNGIHHQAIAYGCAVPGDIAATGNLAEWISDNTQELSCSWLVPIVAKTTHSYLEICDAHYQYGQSYQIGQPCGPLDIAPRTTPYLAISFTATTEIFHKLTMSLAEARRLWYGFRRHHSDPTRVGVSNGEYYPRVPGSRTKSFDVDENAFAFRITWQR
jgi:hypothetical protein